jgi:hypothetical protein
MQSKLAALVKSFMATDAEALCLVPGQKLFVMRSGGKAIVGREILSWCPASP